jgi:transaldolase/glucose-6-phosphate isomerase
MPPATMDAFRDHGVVRETLTEDVEGAGEVLAETERLGLDLAKVTRDLVDDGVLKFSQAFDQLLGAVATKRATILGDRLNPQWIRAGELQDKVDKALGRAADEGWSRRLWSGDAGLWTGRDEANWVGWLAAGKGEAVDIPALDALGAAVKAGGFTHALLLGMGGSSLGPEVLATTFGSAPGFPNLLVLDSTSPDQVARVAGLIDPAKTLFIVASKSGSTLEPDVLHRYFFDLTEKALGVGKAGARFIAITDPGSKLAAQAREQGFWRIFPGEVAIGGRYSVLSNFGMVPAAVIGLDVGKIFDTIRPMVRACGPSAPPAANPGFALGAMMGCAALAGRDKMTLVASDGVADVGAWLEQLLAESTGKLGKGLVPIDGETLGDPEVYGADRAFYYLRLEGQEDPARDAAIRALEEAGQPVVRITLASREMLFQEFFRWEIAVAVAGAIIGIDPFDQPDVEDSKIKTRALTGAYEETGALEKETPFFEDETIALYADPANVAALAGPVGEPTLEAYLGAHFARGGSGDYLALLAYIDRNPEHIAVLQGLRIKLRDRKRLATVAEFGPRFLHSTGQAYKGGPNTGVFLQITADPEQDLPIPGRAFSFGVVVAAEAQGDFSVLAERGRRALRAHLKGGAKAGLARLTRAVERSLS